MPSTRSPRAASRSPLEPFTVGHFRAYCRLLILDNGRRFRLQDFQAELVEDIFAAAPAGSDEEDVDALGFDQEDEDELEEADAPLQTLRRFRETWFIVPEGNGKTTFMAALALYHGDYTPTAMVPIGASSREQAEILYRQAEGFVLRTPGLRDRFKCQEGYRRIKCLRTGGRIQVFAADDRTGDGIIPTLALVDELHRHRNLRLYRVWKGKLKKRRGQIVTISTAGEPASEFEETRERMHKAASDVTRSSNGCHVRAAGDDSVIHDWRVPSRKLAEDMAVVAAANPRSDIKAEALAKDRASPTMTLEHWLRFTCNIAAREGGSPITAEEWDPLRWDDPVDISLPAFGFLDLGWKIDTTAMGVLLWESSEFRLVAGVKVIEPPVDEADIVAGLLGLQERFIDFRGVVYDPNAGGRQMAQLLEKGEHPLQTDDEARKRRGLSPLNGRALAPLEFIEHSQDNAPMALAAVRLDEAIRGSDERKPSLRWAVDGDWEALRRHAFNAARAPLGGEKWKYDRPAEAKGAKRKDYPIDALTGLLMGHSVAVAGDQHRSAYETNDLFIA